MDEPLAASEYNRYGSLVVPGLNISLELFILILYPVFLIPAVILWFNYLQKSKRAAVTPAGCRKLGTRGPSNVQDEYDSKYDNGTDDQQQWKIKALFIHPVKSCSQVEVDELEIAAAGAVWDRKFCFAELLPPAAIVKQNATEEEKKPQWTFRTLRQPGWEKLALIKPEVWIPENTDGKDKSTSRRVERNGALVIKYPNVPSGALAFLDRLMIRWGMLPSMNSFQVPLLVPDNHNYPQVEVKIWTDNPKSLDYGQHLPDDFRRFLCAKGPVTLFRADPKIHREVFRNAPRKEALGYQPVVGFQDAYPINLLNLASIHDVGNKITTAIPQFSARRFRANILLTGPPAYDEDDWKRIKVHHARSDGIKDAQGTEIYCATHCVRCRLPNVDPDTAVRHAVEPDKTLKSFRCIDEGDPKNACMGLQLVSARSEAVTLEVGDRIEVLERGKHVYIKQGA